MQSYQQFYQSIEKPFFAPPEWVFGLAWSIIYPLIALALIYTAYLVFKKKLPRYLMGILVINIVANLLYTPIQLGLESLWPASLNILLILGTLAWFQYKVLKYSKLVFFLLFPYLAWGAFATLLQLTIAFLNKV